MSQIIAITLAIFATSTIGQALDLSRKPMVPMDLTDFLMKSSAAMQRNPQLTTICFNAYTPQLDALAEEYKNDLNKCEDTATASTTKINNEVAGNVDTIDQWRNEICGSYSKCNQGGSDPHGFFECNNAAVSLSLLCSACQPFYLFSLYP